MSTPAQSLLPCPFCGGEPEHVPRLGTARCLNRKCSIYAYAMLDDRWNTRPAQAQEALREALQRMVDAYTGVPGNNEQCDARDAARTALSASKTEGR